MRISFIFIIYFTITNSIYSEEVVPELREGPYDQSYHPVIDPVNFSTLNSAIDQYAPELVDSHRFSNVPLGPGDGFLGANRKDFFWIQKADGSFMCKVVNFNEQIPGQIVIPFYWSNEKNYFQQFFNELSNIKDPLRGNSNVSLDDCKFEVRDSFSNSTCRIGDPEFCSSNPTETLEIFGVKRGERKCYFNSGGIIYEITSEHLLNNECPQQGEVYYHPSDEKWISSDLEFFRTENSLTTDFTSTSSNGSIYRICKKVCYHGSVSSTTTTVTIENESNPATLPCTGNCQGENEDLEDTTLTITNPGQDGVTPPGGNQATQQTGFGSFGNVNGCGKLGFCM